MNEIRRDVAFFEPLASRVTVIHVKVSHVYIVCIYGLFLFLAEWYSIMWTYTISFSLFSVKGHLRCFQFWIMMNKAMVNTHIQVLWEHT